MELRCDENDIWTGKAKDPSVPRATYGTAQKMRAAISHKFGRDYQLGTQPWLEHPAVLGKFIGNPSLSVTISQYMVSLRRRKIRAGEAVMSARAMDEPTMKRLWEFAWSTDRKEFGPISRKRKAENPSEWAGFLLRMMLYLLYLLSMLCLLRYDEALRITWADVTFQVQDLLIKNHWLDATPELFTSQVRYQPTQFRVKLELPFRKTHQYGGIAPFYIYADPDRPWMCLLRAFAIWWLLAHERHEDLNGFIFRKKIGVDGISVSPTDCMTSDSFLECFRNNLLDISVDPRPYGTHSFCRGGCQFLHTVRGWSFRKICDWGGWAENFDNPGTIFKYLLSWNDNPAEAREHYMNPNRPGCDPCYSCGRTCHCG
ncbi:uncharacterized protein HD556DRAFT_1246001 [Suillus plorans]|uniref:Uncharacterized protein n=1 Tax=Suillus plorans TaxID=116603 RepID=A0A9P7AET1_9AGAM|nr:uncharacterized protein HD556DRAFT_1246001 [Suillus plorans]KAG1787906.1 hypothetical protein HD556DRAFT_1246001 [Suillus plorans]